MAETTTASPLKFQIALPTPKVVVPAVPAEEPAPVAEFMTSVAADPQQRDVFNCKALVPPEQLAAVRAEAMKVYQQMLRDPNLQVTYGNEALDALNALVNRLLKEVEPVRIPELNGMLKDLNVQMNAIKGRYDLNDPKFRKEYEESLGKVKKLFRRAKDYIGMIKADIVSIETQLDQLAADLVKRQMQMTRNVGMYTQLYVENEAAIQNLVGAIAVLELIVELATQDVERNYPITSGGPMADHTKDEERQRRTELLDIVKVRVGDLTGRLFVAYATGPESRMMRKLDIGMAAKLSTLAQSTIPTMKQTLLQWRMAMQAMENAQISETIIAANNKWTQEFFAASAQIAPKVEEAIQQPVVWPETMHAIANSLNEAADGVLAAFQAGEQRRDELGRAMVDSVKVLGEASNKVDRAVLGTTIDRITATVSQPLPPQLALPPGVG